MTICLVKTRVMKGKKNKLQETTWSLPFSSQEIFSSNPAVKLPLSLRSVILPSAATGNDRGRIHSQVLLFLSTALCKVYLLINLTPGDKQIIMNKTQAIHRAGERLSS